MAKFLFYDEPIINILLKDEKASGGAAVQALGWIRGLEEHGQDVFIMTRIPKDRELKKENSKLKLIDSFDRRKGIRWIRWVYYRIPYIYKRIKNIRPDYVYLGVPGWISFALGMICRLLHIKFLVRISNDFIVDERIAKKYSGAYRFLLRQGFKSAYCILCQNDYQYEMIQKSFPSTFVVKIANPLLHKYPGNPPPPEFRHYIAWVGLFQYQKNLRLLFEIASAFPGEEFRIAGTEDPACDAESRLFLSRLKELPNVRLVGFLGREQVLNFLSGARFLLNTSHYEGFSNTFLEAMSAGTPILSSEHVNPDGIISRYALGIIYSDPRDLRHKIEKLTPGRYREMSRAVCRYVNENHDHKTLAAELIRLLAKENKEPALGQTIHHRPLVSTRQPAEV